MSMAISALTAEIVMRPMTTAKHGLPTVTKKE
jgi:hypothetical protein